MHLPIIRFNRTPSEFSKILKERIDAYFKENNKSRYGDWRMYLKTACMMALFFVPWGFITFGAVGNGWAFWTLEVIMGVGLAGIGLNVMHDANHGAFSSNKRVNQFIGYVLDLVGGNSTMWKIQHNVLHHSFTNIEGLDEDIDTPGILRFSPNRPLKKIHKFQFIYAWFFYGLMTLHWMTAKDWMALARYRKKGLLKSTGTHAGEAAWKMAGTKLMYFTYILVLPWFFSGVAFWQLLLGWVVMHAVTGIILASIFQPAHVLEDLQFAHAEKGSKMEDDALSHQLKSTANFGTRSRFFTWVCGGLNHQIEHHLFPNICHIHFRKIAPIVKRTAEEFGLPYRSSTTFAGALMLHARMLWKLGRQKQWA